MEEERPASEEIEVDAKPVEEQIEASGGSDSEIETDHHIIGFNADFVTGYFGIPDPVLYRAHIHPHRDNFTFHFMSTI